MVSSMNISTSMSSSKQPSDETESCNQYNNKQQRRKWMIGGSVIILVIVAVVVTLSVTLSGGEKDDAEGKISGNEGTSDTSLATASFASTQTNPSMGNVGLGTGVEPSILPTITVAPVQDDNSFGATTNSPSPRISATPTSPYSSFLPSMIASVSPTTSFPSLTPTRRPSRSPTQVPATTQSPSSSPTFTSATRVPIRIPSDSPSSITLTNTPTTTTTFSTESPTRITPSPVDASSPSPTLTEPKNFVLTSVPFSSVSPSLTTTTTPTISNIPTTEPSSSKTPTISNMPTMEPSSSTSPTNSNMPTTEPSSSKTPTNSNVPTTEPSSSTTPTNSNVPTTELPTSSQEPTTVASTATIFGSYELLETVPHDPSAFTQGLEFVPDSSEQRYYESTGLYGQSSIRIVDLASGGVLQQKDLSDQYFGEGMTYFDNGKLIQITWREQTAFIYDATTLDTIDTLTSYTTTNGEGWGICFVEDQNIFYVSDGTHYIHIWDTSPPYAYVDKFPVRLRPTSTTPDGKSIITITNQNNLNELEWDKHSGTILSNVWQQNHLVRIDPSTGYITHQYDLASLERPSGANVLNGIAITDIPNEIWVTGKLWPSMYRIRLIG